ncbi:MAG TPA: MerR family transcriptional regulator [Streptosporangiaceae bacterium]|jgi:DNA-binding transcriptional MerR regulator
MNAQSAQAYFGIGEVLAQLRGEFPDIRVSKIRFLESEGLIAPARLPSRYRRFSPADVERLRFILTAQRDHYLPLRVIREQLAGPGHPDGQGNDEDGGGGRAEEVLLSRRELLEAAGIDESQLAELEAYGLVRRSGRHYGPDALDAAVAVAALAPFGVQARHLRAVRAAAEREVSLVEQVVAPILRQRSAQSRELAGQQARQVAALLLPLHRALVEAALAEAGLPGAPLAGAGPPAGVMRAPATADPPGHRADDRGIAGASA